MWAQAKINVGEDPQHRSAPTLQAGLTSRHGPVVAVSPSFFPSLMYWTVAFDRPLLQAVFPEVALRCCGSSPYNGLRQYMHILKFKKFNKCSYTKVYHIGIAILLQKSSLFGAE